MRARLHAAQAERALNGERTARTLTKEQALAHPWFEGHTSLHGHAPVRSFSWQAAKHAAYHDRTAMRS